MSDEKDLETGALAKILKAAEAKFEEMTAKAKEDGIEFTKAENFILTSVCMNAVSIELIAEMLNSQYRNSPQGMMAEVMGRFRKEQVPK